MDFSIDQPLDFSKSSSQLRECSVEKTLSPCLDHITSSLSSTSSSTSECSHQSTKTTDSGRKKGKPLPDSVKDAAYWERRRKNNEAAKRSRDARRKKENEIAVRAAFLESENVRLRSYLSVVEKENSRLKFLLCNSAYDIASFEPEIKFKTSNL
ncbi:transcription factor ces-2-like [Brevipalpus obovatus]|uniref:transcription factor ces-2-like n=1 Tax=Brevipalpus obovatus TaxID=246614 RepID=UPI003D9DFE41